MIELHDYVDSHLGVLAAMWRKRSAPTPNSSKPPEPRIPPGRIHHSCFGPDGDLMVHEVWESQQAFEEYGPVLMPILHKAGIDPGTPDLMPIHNLVI